LRDVVDFVEREHGEEIVTGTLAYLAPRLSERVDRQTLRSGALTDVLSSSDAEELLLGLDLALGDGTGALLERALTEHMARVLSSGGMLIAGDLMATVARVRSVLEHVFATETVGFDLAPKRDGFVLFVSVGGNVRTARLLRHVAVSAVHAARRYAREEADESLKIHSEILGNRVRVDVRSRRDEPEEVAAAVPVSRPPARRAGQPHLPQTKPTLEAAERIIRASAAPPSPRRVEVIDIEPSPRSRRPISQTDRPPRSDTLPSARMPDEIQSAGRTKSPTERRR